MNSLFYCMEIDKGAVRKSLLFGQFCRKILLFIFCRYRISFAIIKTEKTKPLQVGEITNVKFWRYFLVSCNDHNISFLFAALTQFCTKRYTDLRVLSIRRRENRLSNYYKGSNNRHCKCNLDLLIAKITLSVFFSGRSFASKDAIFIFLSLKCKFMQILYVKRFLDLIPK